MNRPGKAILASARHPGRRITSTLGPVPRLEISQKFAKEALRTVKHRIRNGARRVVQMVNSPVRVEVEEVGLRKAGKSSGADRSAPEIRALRPNTRLEQEFGFWVVRFLPGSRALDAFRSDLATELPKLGQAASGFNDAVENNAPDQHKLLGEVLVHFQSVRDSTAAYTQLAKAEKQKMPDAIPDLVMQALDDMLASIDKKLTEISKFLKDYRNDMKATDISLSNDSETSESLVN